MSLVSTSIQPAEKQAVEKSRLKTLMLGVALSVLATEAALPAVMADEPASTTSKDETDDKHCSKN